MFFLASYLKVCKRTVDDLNKCVEDTINNIRNELGDGIKELGVPPLKRLEIPQLKFTISGGPGKVDLVFNDLIFRGGENYIIKNVNVDLDKGIFDVAMLVPFFHTTSKYHMHGKFTVLDVDAGGELVMNFSK